jgi:hypothetical protein
MEALRETSAAALIPAGGMTAGAYQRLVLSPAPASVANRLINTLQMGHWKYMGVETRAGAIEH